MSRAGQTRRQAHTAATSRPALIMRKACACARPMGPTGECTECRRKRLGVQTKLMLNRPGDKFEREADRVSEQVMRMPAPELSETHPDKPHVQGKVDANGEDKALVQAKKTAGQTAAVTPQVQDRINSLRSGGQPLPETARSFFEPRFGVDFSQVRIHQDSEAAHTAQQVQARAFTIGRHIVFNRGTYSPHSAEGRKLLAHELTHVVQQSGGNDPRAIMRAPLPEGEPKPMTFGSIYLEVEQMNFKAVHEVHLANLDLSELRTLNSLVERKIEFFSDLALKQAADPKFKPPEGVPDIIFKNAVREYREFKKDRLEPYLLPMERKFKTPEIAGPWVEKIRKNLSGETIGCAVAYTLHKTTEVIKAELKGETLSFSDKDLVRYGYLDKSGAYEVMERAIPEDKEDKDLQIISLHRMLAKMRERKTILPLELAKSLMTRGTGEPDDVKGVIESLRNTDKEIVAGIGLADLKRVGGTPWTSTRGLPPNAMYYWFQQLSDPSENALSVYSCYHKDIER